MSDVKRFVHGDNFEVKFEGVGSFDEKVVFVKPISSKESLRIMNQEMFKAFTDKGFVCDLVFTPHVTLVKNKFKEGKEMGKIPADFLENFAKKYFGIQTIPAVQLLSMKKPQTEEGYYFCEEEFRFEEKTYQTKEEEGSDASL